MRLFSLLALTITLIPSMASAFFTAETGFHYLNREGFYIQGFGGYTVWHKVFDGDLFTTHTGYGKASLGCLCVTNTCTLSVIQPASSTVIVETQRIRPKKDFLAGGSLGYYLGPFRLEGEFSYRDPSIELGYKGSSNVACVAISATSDSRFTCTPSCSGGCGGCLIQNSDNCVSFCDNNNGAISASTLNIANHTSRTAYMFNALYDYQLFPRILASVGGGVGFAETLYTIRGKLTAKDTTSDIYFKEKDYRFAFQLIGGLAFEVTERITLISQYKLFGTLRTSKFTRSVAGTGNTSVSITFKENGTPLMQSVEAGIRISL